MSDNIVSLPGIADVVSGDRAPCEEICERLRSLLAEAEAGKVRAIAYAFVDRAGAAFNGWVSAQDEMVGHSLIAAVTYLHHEIVKEKISGDPIRAERPV